MNKKYWLRGGIVGGAVGLLLLFISISVDNPQGVSLFILEFFRSTIFKIYLFLSLGGMAALFWMPLMYVLFGLMIGIIIGWIYGEIKNRNKSI